MSGAKLPTIFISHGAPTMAIEQIPAREFLGELGDRLSDVEAVLCVSAHWATTIPSVNATERPETIHDFSGFPSELYRIEYPARGAPDLARRVADMLGDAGISCDVDGSRGLDHGAWIPMMLMYPKADMPVLQLSIQRQIDPAAHHELGLAMAVLRKEGVLVVGSGTSGQITEYPVPTPVSWSRNGSCEMYLVLSTYGSRGDVEQMVAVAGPRRTTVNRRQMPNNVSTALRRESPAVLDGE